jgi:hypothetical protein
MPFRSLAAAAVALLLIAMGRAEADPAADALAREIFKQLIEINTTESVGSVTAASEAMAERHRTLEPSRGCRKTGLITQSCGRPV